MKKKLVIPERAAGVLLHISSLPGKYGIGTMGKEARAFADFLHAAGVRYWQVLPLVQTGYGDSPLSVRVRRFGQPVPDRYRRALPPRPHTPRGDRRRSRAKRGVDYGMLYRKKYALLRTAFSRLIGTTPHSAPLWRRGVFTNTPCSWR